MNKYLKIAIRLVFVGILVFFGYKIVSKISHKKEVANHIKTIPAFEYQNTKGGVFGNKNLLAKTPTVFVYFNSECEFCNEEANMIKQNITKLKNVQLVFVSFEASQIIKKFAQKHQLDTYDNVNFLCDSKVIFATTFDVKSLPCLVLYDKNQHLIEKIKGQIKVEVLLKKLKQN
jgi:peroxiredoxin